MSSILEDFQNNWNDDKIYRDGKTFKEYYSLQFYKVTFGYTSKTVMSYDNICELLKSTPKSKHAYQLENILDSWINLLREWYVNVRNKNVITYLYYSKVKYHTNFYKIGITMNIENRQISFGNKYYDFEIIKEYKNRYACAYLEYKIRTLFCYHDSEIIDKTDINEVIQFVEDFHYNKKVKEELKLLGWK